MLEKIVNGMKALPVGNRQEYLDYIANIKAKSDNEIKKEIDERKKIEIERTLNKPKNHISYLSQITSKIMLEGKDIYQMLGLKKESNLEELNKNYDFAIKNWNPENKYSNMIPKSKEIYLKLISEKNKWKNEEAERIINEENAYKILSANPKMSIKEIKSLYNAFSKEWNHDNNKENQTGKFKNIFSKGKDAKEKLETQRKKNKFDAWERANNKQEKETSEDEQNNYSRTFNSKSLYKLQELVDSVRNENKELEKLSDNEIIYEILKQRFQNRLYEDQVYSNGSQFLGARTILKYMNESGYNPEQIKQYQVRKTINNLFSNDNNKYNNINLLSKDMNMLMKTIKDYNLDRTKLQTETETPLKGITENYIESVTIKLLYNNTKSNFAAKRIIEAINEVRELKQYDGWVHKTDVDVHEDELEERLFKTFSTFAKMNKSNKKKYYNIKEITGIVSQYLNNPDRYNQIEELNNKTKQGTYQNNQVNTKKSEFEKTKEQIRNFKNKYKK